MKCTIETDEVYHQNIVTPIFIFDITYLLNSEFETISLQLNKLKLRKCRAKGDSRGKGSKQRIKVGRH